MKLSRTIRYYYLKLRRIQGTPSSLAMGSAIGVFMALMPIAPLRTISLLAVTFMLKANVLVSLIVATVICNPFTYIPLYYLAFVAGNAVTPFLVDWERVEQTMGLITSSKDLLGSVNAVISLGAETLTIMLAGGLAMALPAGLVTYVLALRFYTSRRDREP